MPTKQTTPAAKPFAVNLYGSHPSQENDDCHTGHDYATLAEARHDYDNWSRAFSLSCVRDTAFVEITGPGLYEVKQVVTDNEIARRVQRLAAEERAERAAWAREIANEAGMLGGCDAFNETMGY